ncbi:acyl-CoA dehydrogenase family protein [Kitasatospora aureofaciens]|uniref:acyl-CoA dehydrogenase family protein n=1 Tax=Kitasatospora aureofaciens TaxID=1894 RepID=UPI001C453EAF|nr:acyl-CoA dehydrogenase family protein [Kitasatospora aureofaciens]MBV6699350.1 acyl-CoA dehydrogenase family protein [Kitasatospora aureofaciens]
MIDWSADQRDLREGLAPWFEKFGADHLRHDKAASFPREAWQAVAESGLLGLFFDEQYGGLGQDLATTMYVLEGLGHGCRNGGLNFSVTTSMVGIGAPLHRFGSPALKERYLPGIATGTLIGAHAISEPDAGSDALAMRTTAVADGDAYVLNGSKTFVSNGPIADVIAVYAKTDPTAGPLGVTTFLVERDTPGLSVGRPVEKMGLKSSPMAELFFDDCRIPRGQVVGRAGTGFLILDHVMKWEILLSFAVTLGEMQRRLEDCLAYAKQRSAFGKPIGSFQSVANKIVEMRIGVETSRKWLYDTAEKLTAGQNITVDLAAAKLVVSEASLASALHAVQIFGGNGYMAEYGIEQELRNAVAGTIYSGTSEVQRVRIATMLGL